MQIFLRLTGILFLLFTLSHCASYETSKRIVQQGNLLPEHKINQLRVGMHKTTVASLMGTSLISPMFTNDRWDYAYTWRKGSTVDQIKYVSIYFSNDQITRIEHGDKAPADGPIQGFARFLRFSLGQTKSGR